MRMNEQPRAACEMCNRAQVQFRRSASALPEDCAVAMAYVPVQTDTAVYDCEQALCRGTLFTVLDKPFKRGCKQ